MVSGKFAVALIWQRNLVRDVGVCRGTLEISTLLTVRFFWNVNSIIPQLMIKIRQKLFLSSLLPDYGKLQVPV